MQSVARRIVDGQVLRLIKLWLKVPVEERDGEGIRRMTGGKENTCGTPQGGVISPLLANLYMNRFLKHWRSTGRGDAYRAHIVNYPRKSSCLTALHERIAHSQGHDTRRAACERSPGG